MAIPLNLLVDAASLSLLETVVDALDRAGMAETKAQLGDRLLDDPLNVFDRVRTLIPDGQVLRLKPYAELLLIEIVEIARRRDLSREARMAEAEVAMVAAGFDA